MTTRARRGGPALLAALAAACARPTTAPVTPVPPPLRAAVGNAFLVGAALNARQFSGQDTLGAALVTTNFNTITPENVLKWEYVHPREGAYDFAAADQYVAFGEQHGMFIVGHTLVWHNQTPSWVFVDSAGNPLGRVALLERLRDHIQTVVGRYRGRVRGWDVVNEALNEDGSLRQTRWQQQIGDDYLEWAFRFAYQADPEAELYYNDFSLENAPKRQAALNLVRRLREEGIPITAVGLQGHDRMEWPSTAQVDTTVAAFADAGFPVMITELDIDMLPRPNRAPPGADVSAAVAPAVSLNPYPNGLPDSLLQVQARRYTDLFAAFLRHPGAVKRVTFWGVTDRDSWLNDWPVPGRTNYPLLFDRDGRPKPAFAAVVAECRHTGVRP